MNCKFALLSTASVVAFANAAPKAPATPAPAASESAAKRRERADVAVLGIAAPMSLPQSAINSRRGKGSKYKFDDLGAPVPNPDKPGEYLYHSFGLTGMDKKGFNSTLFSANQRYKKQVPKIGADGQPETQTVEVKDASGAVIGTNPVPVMIDTQEREFIAHEVDPKTDHEKASLRVFRIK